GFGIADYPGNYTSNASLKDAPFNGIYSPTIGGTNCQSSIANAIETGEAYVGTLPACQTALGQTNALSQGIPVPVPQALNSPSLSLPDNVALNYRTSYVEQWNLLVQKEIGLNVLTVGYIGSVGRHLPATLNDINLQDPLDPNAVRASDGRLDFRPLSTVLPNLGGVGMYMSIGTSNYNALQTSFERRYQNGLTLNANFTWAHSLDDVTTLSMEGQ